MDFLPHEAENQEEFVYASFRLHRRKATWAIYSIDYREDVTVWLYKLGRDYQLLFMDFEEFKLIILDLHKKYSLGVYYGTYKRYWSRRSHYCHPDDYRVLRGFNYNGEPKKNSPNRNDWWEHSGVYKDRRRCNWSRGHWKKDLKHYGKRKHRQLERQAIKHERYEILHQWTYKQAENPWSWD